MEAVSKGRCCTGGGWKSSHFESKLVTAGPLERGFKAKVKFDASMPDNYDFDEPELEGDIAVDKDARR